MIPLPRDFRGMALSLAVSAGVATAVLMLAGCVFAATGTPIARGIGLIVSGAIGSTAAIHETLARGGIVILTGLAAALAFRIKLNNFGAEGQLQAGALAAVGLASVTAAWPTWAILPIQLVAGAVAGAVIMLGATLLKLRRGADEGIVTLLINFVMVLMVDLFLSDGPGPAVAAIGSGAPLGLVIALAAAVLIAAATHFTVLGFALRATASNAEAARYAGIPIVRLTIQVGIASGALAGLAGVCLFADTGNAQHPGLGYAGIAVAVLARFSPIGSVFAGLFIAALMVGADAAMRAGAPSGLAEILAALALLAKSPWPLHPRARRRDGDVMTPTTALFQDPAFWTAVLTISTPLVFGIMGALLCARAGELDFGIAGVFLIGALIGLVLRQHGVNPWIAVLAVVGAAMTIGLLQGILTGPLGISQPLVGIALTLLGIGIAHAGWPSGPTPAAAFHPFDAPFLSGLPYVGEVLARRTPLDLLAVLTALVIAYVLNRMPLGLAIRACGDNPFAVEVQGRSVHALRIGAVIAGSAIMALGGAAIALTASDLVAIDTIGGRGILCLALAAAAGWRPGLAFAAALLFGAIDAAAPHLQLDFGVRAPIMAMVPYLLVIVALAATRRRLRWPAALSAPYVKRRAS